MPAYRTVTFEPGIAGAELIHRLPREPIEMEMEGMQWETQVVQNISVETKPL